MTLNAGIEAELPFLQAEAEARMVDTCLIRRKSGPGVPDPVTLKITPTYTTIYSGKCEFQLRDTIAVRPEAGERVATVVRTITKVPVSATGVEVGDEVVAQTSRDPDLVGAVLRVKSRFHKTYATCRRLECEETQQ